MSNKSKFLNWMQSYIIDGRPPNSVGPREYSNGGWTDLKPWREVYDNGIFVGYDDSVWAFFKTPQNVKTEWLKNERQIIENQSFFNDVVKELATRLNQSIVKKRDDPRRKFRISIIRSPFEHLHWDEKLDTPATISYRKRMSEKIDRSEFEGYFGVELMQSTASSSATSIREFSEWFIAGHENVLSLYQSDYRDVKAVLERKDFEPLTNFDLDSPDFLNLTCWHGLNSDSYHYQKHLTTTRFQEPTDGFSVITPAWGEISFYAAVPSEERESFGEDPKSEGAKWAKPLFSPENDTVGIWIEGEIRGKRHLNAVLDQKRWGRKEAMDRVPEGDYSEGERVFKDLNLVDNAKSAAVKNDFIDNAEILVAVKCFINEKHKLREHLREYGMDCRMPVSRQAQCLARTIPCYPDGISKMYKNNFTRGPFSTQMFPGALSMSGIFQRTRPSSPNGILLGLTNGDNQYRELFTEIDAASRHSATPIMMITGRQGSGKTMQGLQMMMQAVYDNRPVIFLNPKPDASFQHVFDYLGGVTITLTDKFLDENPGMYDPFHFLSDRNKVYSQLYEAISKALSIDHDIGSKSKVESARMSSDLKNRVMDKRNNCSADVIFGNKIGRENYKNAVKSWNQKLKVRMTNEGKGDDFVEEVDGAISEEGNNYIQEYLSSMNGTAPLPQLDIRRFVRARMNTSPLWKALISTGGNNESKLQSMMSAGRPILIEWDGTLSLPDVNKDDSSYSSQEIDSIISVTLSFKYAEEIIVNLGRGGMLAVDEAWTLKGSREAKAILNSSSKEWRERNIMMLLMTQKISDFGSSEDGSLVSGISRFLFMATPPSDMVERKLFFSITELEDSERVWDYMVNAGIKGNDNESTKKSIAEGYYLDKIQGYSGGILCGPWPDYELIMARTDKEGKILRDKVVQNNGQVDVKILEDSQYYVTAANFHNMVLADADAED